MFLDQNRREVSGTGAFESGHPKLGLDPPYFARISQIPKYRVNYPVSFRRNLTAISS